MIMNESQNTWNEMNRNQINTHDNWKPRLLVVGAAAGAFLGLGAAYLLARSSEEQHGGPPEVTTGDLLKLGVGVFGIMRGIAALAD